MGKFPRVVAVVFAALLAVSLHRPALPRAAGAEAGDKGGQVPAGVTAAEAKIKDLYRAEYGDHAAAGRLRLAKTLLEQGRDQGTDPAFRYVCFREARDLSASAGDTDIAFAAVEEMDKAFGAAALVPKINALIAAANSGGVAPGSCAAAAEAGLDLLDEALAADNPRDAGRLVPALKSLAEKARPVQLPLVSKVGARERAIKDLNAAEAAIKKKPDDPAANLVLGMHHCFTRGDWGKGLPMLAKGSDATLRDLAKKELAKPADAPGQLALADGWWDAGGRRDEPARSGARRHAAELYARALPALTSADDKVRASQRSAAQPPPQPPEEHPGGPRPPTRPNTTDAGPAEPGAADAGNLLKDPSFDTIGTAGVNKGAWFADVNGSAKLTATVDKADAAAPALKLAVTAVTPQLWDAVFGQHGLSLRRGQTYTLSFRARADPPVQIDVAVEGKGFKNLGLYATPGLTDRFAEYRFHFAPNEDSDAASLVFKIGRKVSDVYLGDLQLRPGRWVGLLPLIDVKKDAVRGKWAAEDGAVVSDAGQFSRLRIPYRPPQEYDFRVRFARKQGTKWVAQLASGGGHGFAWLVGYEFNQGSGGGFEQIKGQPWHRYQSKVTLPTQFKPGEPHESVVRVRGKSIEAYLDGKRLSRYDTDFSDLGLSADWAIDPGTLGVGTDQSATAFDLIEVREVTGEGKPLPRDK